MMEEIVPLGFVVADADVPAVSPVDEAFPPMVGRVCRLERLEPCHLHDLFVAFAVDGDSLWTYMFNGPFATESEFVDYCESCFLGKNSFCCGYAIIDCARNAPVGISSFLNIDIVHKTVEVGYLTFSSAMKKSLISTEAMYLMAYAAFDAGYRRYEWKCNALNAASAAAAQRLGFTFEGIFSQAKIAKTLNRDTAWFTIVDLDWPPLQQCFRTYMSPSNFDSEGKQIAALSVLTSSLLHRTFSYMPADGGCNSFGQAVGAVVPSLGQKAVSPYDESFPLMNGHYCRLEKLDRQHVHELYSAFTADGDRLWAYMFHGPFSDEIAFGDYVDGHFVSSQDPTMFGMAIIDNYNGSPVGICSFLAIDTIHRTMEVGSLVFSSRMKKSLVSTEAMFLMAKAAFDSGYRRYEWKCNSLNRASVAAAQRLGFSYECTFRQHKIVKGRNRDTAWFSMLDYDWPSLRNCFESYLLPTNFDIQGRQILSLSSLTAKFVHSRYTAQV
jgi:RimJ/RimL family protein N-acetyltransferase